MATNGHIVGLYDRLTRQGRKQVGCLHFDANDACGPAIASHSIQRRGQLQLIAEEGHVYRPSLHPSNRGFQMRRVGIKDVSTFPGFCARHDSELFAPIDSVGLVPTDEQVALYAHRCLCREVSVRQIATGTAKAVYEAIEDHAMRQMSSGHLQGLENGTVSLLRHKRDYDRSLKSRRYSDFAWVAFCSQGEWTHQLSGVLYPDFDWQSNLIQDLGDRSSQFELLAYFTAPMSTGWALVLAWHETSSQICTHFLRSLATAVCDGMPLQDGLFRLLSCSENQAVRVSWWDAADPAIKSAIRERAMLIASLVDPVPANYLMRGLEGISPWHFRHVVESRQPSSGPATSTR